MESRSVLRAPFPIVYLLECNRLGLGFLAPLVNEPARVGAAWETDSPASEQPQRLRQQTVYQMLPAHREKPLVSMHDFFDRATPPPEELEGMICVGAFDEFGESRTRQFRKAQHLIKRFGGVDARQPWLIPPPGWEHLPTMPLTEPTCRECLEAETEAYGYAVSVHPLEPFNHVDWAS